MVAIAPVAGAFEIVAGIARLRAAEAEAIGHMVEVALGIVDALAAIFPALRLGRRNRCNAGSDRQSGEAGSRQQSGDFHESPQVDVLRLIVTDFADTHNMTVVCCKKTRRYSV